MKSQIDYLSLQMLFWKEVLNMDIKCISTQDFVMSVVDMDCLCIGI